MGDHETRRIVITGGPGSGKTTLIEALAEAGFATAPEAGRSIIRDQQAIGGLALPFADRLAFAEAMLAWEMRSHREATGRGIVFFDRGVPDVIGYLRVCGLDIPAHLQKAAELFRYEAEVFIAPPWPEIYRGDAERRQDHDEAVRTYEAMIATYGGLGYRLIPLPLAPVPERLRFVLGKTGVLNPG